MIPKSVELDGRDTGYCAGSWREADAIIAKLGRRPANLRTRFETRTRFVYGDAPSPRPPEAA